MASPISALSNVNSSASNAPAGLGSSAPSEEVFLQLLVSQIKNQDPLNPTDSTTFVSQLAQFSELEQVIAIRADTDALKTTAAQSAAQASSGSGSSNSTSGNSQTSDNSQTSNTSGGTDSTGQTQA